MIQSYDEEEENENSLNIIMRDPQYKKEIYQIKEEIKQNENLYKLYGNNLERNLNVVITKVINISEKDNPNFPKRLLTTIKLIEENKLLVENLWLEKISRNNYYLYVSELTNTIYRNEYDLITLNNYMCSTKNTYKDNIQILILIVQRMLYFQKYDFSHLNIHPNNIYISIKKRDLIYFGPPKIVKDYTNDCTFLWYSSPEEIFIEDKIYDNNEYSKYNDIWSLGCIICELFFINFPLFQAYSQNEKINKIIDIIGFPSYKDVDYMNKYQYDSLYKKSLNHSKDNNLFELLLSNKEKKSNLYYFKVELIEIIKGCLCYNIRKRLKLEDILHRLDCLNNNISSEFHSKIYNNINITEESESNNSSKNNFNYNDLTINKSLESEEFNKDKNNIIKENENKYSFLEQNNKSNISNKLKNDLKKNYKEIKTNININTSLEKDKIYMKESAKKNNIIDYFQDIKNKKEKDKYNELNESKYNIFNNIFLFHRNR